MKDVRMIFVLALLIAAPMVPFTTSDSIMTNPSDKDSTSGRASTDYMVLDITAGNVTSPAETWNQSTGGVQDYLLRGQMYAVEVTFKNIGDQVSTWDSFGKLEIVHPIGYVMDTWVYNFTGSEQIAAGQAKTFTVEWIPDSAHSYIGDDGNLGGGIILRGSIDSFIDNNPSNDVHEEAIPVALWHDIMEPSQTPTYNTPMFYPIAYQTRAAGDLYLGGTAWQGDNSSAVAGNEHWRISSPDNDYPSNNLDTLRWGWFIPGGGSCSDPGHGLGYGQSDGDIQAITGLGFCAVNINEFDYKSLHWATNAWGSMAQGDELAMEAYTGFNSYPSNTEALNLTEEPLFVTGQWMQVVWNMTDVHDENSFMIAYTKIADPSFANEGIHIDDFVLFGVERVNEFTVTLDCDDPLPNAYVVIPADPNPPSLHCMLTNNGYRKKIVTVRTEVDNSTWMDGYPLRIDSSNMVDHDNVVTLEEIDDEGTTEFWVNLSVPEGANIETLNWTVRVTSNNFGNNDDKAVLVIPVSVDSSFSVRLDRHPSNAPTVALTLEPGQTGDVPMKIKNTGNEFAEWNLGAYFGSNLWSSANLAWFEDWDGDQVLNPVNRVPLAKGEERFLTARFTAPPVIPPGQVSINLLASGVPPANAQSVKSLIIDVPVIQEVVVQADEPSITASANGVFRTMPFTITNNGNAAEIFDLTLNADWKIGAYLNTQTSAEIEPFGGTDTVMVIVPMEEGLAPNPAYRLTVIATAQTTPGGATQPASGSGYFDLEVPTTYIVDIEDKNMSGQIFTADGQTTKTLSMDIFNHGNVQDAFTLALSMDSGVNAEIISGVSDGRTPYIEPGDSTSVTIRYWFDSGLQGNRKLTLEATSVEGTAAGVTITGSGDAIFLVGTLGFINVAPVQAIVIDEPGTFQVNVRVLNQHPVNTQGIELEVIKDNTERWDYIDRVRPSASDVSGFLLNPGAFYNVTLEIRVTETNMENMPQDTIEYNFTLMVLADDDVVDVPISFTVEKFVEDGEEGGTDYGSLAKDVTLVGLGILVILALVVVLVKIIRSTEHEDEISTLSGYETSLGLPDAPSLPEAPSLLPSDDLSANSMYGGTEQLFEQPVMATPPPPSEPISPAPTAEPAPVPEPAAGPPLPESGLPEGWTMEQWEHYGEEYLRRQSGG
ncbi:MAG: hypothetical protein VX320_05855 [Candidatus Thermoplasmatota archaeon]|nr:hypothetical protein [Candidatus Thermoplasmatota archaeon]